MKLNRVLLVIKLVEILAFHFLVKIIIGNTLENWDKNFNVKPWMLFTSFHEKKGVEPYTTKNIEHNGRL